MSKKPAEKKETPVQQPAVPQWIEQMHQYYQQHGYYRGADVQRVLGDPAGSVKGETTEVVVTNSHPKRWLVVG
jgi:hypothetical protein